MHSTTQITRGGRPIGAVRCIGARQYVAYRMPDCSFGPTSNAFPSFARAVNAVVAWELGGALPYVKHCETPYKPTQAQQARAKAKAILYGDISPAQHAYLITHFNG